VRWCGDDRPPRDATRADHLLGGVLDLYDHLSEGWTLIGGQLVHLHCARDFAAEGVNKTDRRRLGQVVKAIRADAELPLELPDARASIDRLVVAAKLPG
jgi:hypothetical protein